MSTGTVIRASIEIDFGDRAVLLPPWLRLMLTYALLNTQELVVSPVFDEEKRRNMPLPRSLMERADRYALFLISSGHRSRKGDKPRPAHGQVFRDGPFEKAVDQVLRRVLDHLADERSWRELLRKANGRHGQLSFTSMPAAEVPLVLQLHTCESYPQNVAISAFFRNGRS